MWSKNLTCYILHQAYTTKETYLSGDSKVLEEMYQVLLVANVWTYYRMNVMAVNCMQRVNS